MKVEKTVQVKPVKATTRIVTKVYCDYPDCGNEIVYQRYGGGGGSCGICNRDVCSKHRTYDPDEPGDYPAKWCIICESLFLQPRREMNERHWKEEEALERKVKKESLAWKPSS